MPLGQEPPQLLKSLMFYQGRKFSYEVSRFKLPNKSIGDYECIRHPGGSMAVPVTADGQFVLVRQYRFAMQGRLLEFPAGTVEKGETPLETIQREIQEETGYKANTWKTLGNFPNAPGYSDEIIYAYLATDLEKLPEALALDEDEDIEVIHMSADELEKAILTGTPIDAKSIAAFYMAKAYL
ncbi:MAG: NUDIX hydrolase [Phormidesmis priestleyi]|uniref:NUDIX hydrolase n=1 Tax=Phormidesmis priestleyi TaxID=268141 RepID=A0A2W4Z6V5_9CYAN|nr:MAG: NUDIX hydrolase [Phormidesmis priestleyi]